MGGKSEREKGGVQSGDDKALLDRFFKVLSLFDSTYCVFFHLEIITHDELIDGYYCAQRWCVLC